MSEQNKCVYNFVIDGIDSSIANSLRRIIIGKIPTIVIDTVCIQKNDSAYCDEMICNRLGLIPLKREETETKTNYSITLEENGPKTVYSRDIIFPSGISPVSGDIIIIKLNDKETIKLSGYTEEGTALENAKWSASCGTSYKQLTKTSYEFHIETTGCISAKDCFLKSIDILKEDLVKVKKLIS